MFQGKRRSWVRGRLLGSCVLLALALVLVTACRGTSNSADNSTGSSSGAASGTNNNTQVNTTGSQASTGSNVSMGANSNAACDQMTKVVISEHSASNKEDEYTFSPDHVTIKAGQFITFANQSDEIHVLTTTPDAGLAHTAIDRSEDQPVQFTKAGTYTLESQDAKHRASMQVTVTSTVGTTCGMSAPTTTVTFTAQHTQGRPEVYELTPRTVSIKAGQSLALLNNTAQTFSFTCKPSADLAQGNLRVDKDEQQIVQFDKAGQYTCSSSEAPAQTIALTVH